LTSAEKIYSILALE